MTQPDQNIPKLDDVLSDVTQRLRQTPVSDALVDRCRANALAIETTSRDKLDPQPTQSPNWAMALVLAASVVVAVNVFKLIAQRPPADRQVTAVLQLPDGRNQLVYSDQTIELTLESNLLLKESFNEN